MIAGESNTDDINTLPDYITSLEFADTAERGRSWGGQGANFGRLDVVSGSTGWTGAPILKTGEFTDPMVLILKRTDSPAFRLTLILGNNPNEAGFDDPEGQLITIDDGSGSVSEFTGNLDLDRTEGYTTYQTWDISAGSSDIEIELIGMPEGTGVARLTGFAIDVAGVNPPEILGQPVGGLFLAGTQIELSVSAGGSNPKFQWHKDGQVIAGATNSILSLNNLNSTDAGAYHVVVSNSGGSATSEVAEISLAENLSAQIANYQAKVAAVPSLISNYTFDIIDKCKCKKLLIPDGDIVAAISTSIKKENIDLYTGIGGAPEGVLAAAALKCLGGQMQCRLIFKNDIQKDSKMTFKIIQK